MISGKDMSIVCCAHDAILRCDSAEELAEFGERFKGDCQEYGHKAEVVDQVRVLYSDRQAELS